MPGKDYFYTTKVSFMIRTIRLFFAVLIVSIGFTACEKEYSEESGVTGTGGGSQTGTAEFTLAGAPGACVTPVISGSYVAGAALDASNSIILIVDVTTIGTYVISTGTSNGVSFTGSGTFTITGSQIIVLTGTGTPTAAGTFNYNPGNNGCAFPITFTTVPTGPVAVFTLAGAPNACTTPVITGVYATGVPMGSGNTITVTANVTTAGSYSLSTNSANGITFSSSGTLTVGTAQTIVLTGSGTPVAAATSTFTIGTNGCTFPITTINPPQAVYTTTGAPGACNPITVNGSYNTGTALSGTSNTAAIEVNVITAGAYTITTGAVNGMTFTASGYFATTGTSIVTLAGSGTPTAVGTNTFTLGTGGCTFPVTVTAPTSPCSGLVDDRFVMAGQFQIDGSSFGLAANGNFEVTLSSGTGLNITVSFVGLGAAPTPGTYSVGAAVKMESLYISGTTAIDWNATGGSVYVSVNGSGETVLEFCGVNFTGAPIPSGASISSTGSARMIF